MKSRNIFSLMAVLLLIASAFVVNSCKKDTEDIPEPEPSPPVPETTVVLSEQIWDENFLSIDSTDYTLYFKKSLTDDVPIEVGDIIVSTEGYGLLRKVSKISETDGEIKVETEFATLTEAVNKGSTSFSEVLSVQKITQIKYHHKGVYLDTSEIRGSENTNLEYSIDVLFGPGNEIHLQGDFAILTAMSGQLEIDYIPPRIKLFEITYNVTEELNLSADVELIDIAYENEVDLASVYFQPIVVPISGIPLVLVPELEIAVGVNADAHCNVITGVNQSLDYTMGIVYEDKEWSTINELNKTFDFTPPQLNCNVAAKGYVRPQVNVLIYGVVAPYLYGDLYERIEANTQLNPWWNFYAGAGIGIGVEAEILGKEIFDYSSPYLINYEELIAHADLTLNEPPVKPFNPTPTDGATKVPLTEVFSWECNDPEQDPLIYDLYLDNTNPPSILMNNISPGDFNLSDLQPSTTYYWKIVAKDDHGNSTEGDVWEFTTESSSNIYFSDDFNRAVIGQNWNVRYGNWSIEDNMLKHIGDNSFNSNFLLLDTEVNSDHFTVECDIMWQNGGFFEDGIGIGYNVYEFPSNNGRYIDDFSLGYLSSWQNDRAGIHHSDRTGAEQITYRYSNYDIANVVKNKWYHFRMEATKESESTYNIKLFINEELMMQQAILLEGNVIALGGWKGEYEQVVYFDNFAVQTY